ncbi:uncharacterized protein LOC126668584 [Mercurialis annua]|uniref:uncharacterized protein LOC126668584 n=1 Tax=Mercurialis annua TaxID=3986 RepID=UPI00215F0EF2|nr:uncharacterized protein LOC126668584 [Mercurialis annua]
MVILEEHYHGRSSVAVPFTWESQPGTPKIKYYRENPLPPLTPPPSYFYNTPTKKHSKPNNNNLLSTIFPKRVSPASSSSSSSSSSFSSRMPSTSFYSVPSSPITVSRSRVRHGTSNPRKSFDLSSRMVVDETECDSTLCFGANVRSRGCYASMIKEIKIVKLKSNSKPA